MSSTTETFHWTDGTASSGAPCLERRTREWTFRLGACEIAFRSTAQLCSTTRSNAPPLQRGGRQEKRGRFLALGLAATVPFIGAVSAGAIMRSESVRQPYRVERLIPEVPVLAVVAHKSPVRHLFHAVRAHASARSSVEPADNVGLETDAIATAMSTGEIAEWTPGQGLHGYVVAGPAETVGSLTCRNLSILSRGAADGDHVRSDRRCTSPTPTSPTAQVAVTPTPNSSPPEP